MAANYSLFFYDKQSVLTFLSALSLFMVFEKWNAGYIRWINIVATATFGVYLIHDSETIRYLLWHELFKNAQYQESIHLIPYSIIVTAIVYVVCTLIDLLRQQLLEKPFIVLVNHCSKKTLGVFETVINSAKSLVFGEEN